MTLRASPMKLRIGTGIQNSPQQSRPSGGRLIQRPAQGLARTASPADQYFTSDRRPIILFDGVCNLCNGGVNTALRFDREGKLRFAALQSPAGKQLLLRSGRAADDLSSIVLVERNKSYIKSEAILRIAKYMEIPFPLLAQFVLPLPLFLRDAGYDAVAKSRYNIFGRSTVCRMKDEDHYSRFLE